ncbi:Anoctamin-1 Discovered on gastrointestinal stromal tumors protein 1 [Takifugu flavidus]|uniref:Anoctamin n=1 Tax=Takifugu flavidus TaxID=433684 RepID=A0A5C6NCM7_9TELE|nr:Anoctamin-1 Discovered on gastrointestinal stromal tumors protein 1 [Takifugu flavidus]
MALRRSPSSPLADTWTGGGFREVATALSESSSIHSEALYNLTKDMSGLGLEPMSYTLLEPRTYREPPWREESRSLFQPRNSMPKSASEDKRPVVESPRSPRSCETSLCFSDGRRKVDYVLVFHQRRHGSLRSPATVSASREMLSIVSNGNFPPAGSDVEAARGGGAQRGGAAGAGEAFVEVRGREPAEPAFYEMPMIREEFEANLLEAGLELERDSEVRAHGPSFTRLHAPWPVLCREAEFLKIKVPTKTSYKLKEESGFGSRMSSVWRTLKQPFQPKVPHQDQESTKFLSHCFSRDKLHLYNITSKDTFFDNATRGRIVYEILRRTVCARTCQTIGISTLIAKGVYDAAFPLHDGDFAVVGQVEEKNDRQVLHQEWARYSAFYKYQPIDLVRKYFGEKIGLYFAWLGVYTQLLIPASVVGIIVFGYGVATMNTNIPSQEMCDDSLNFTMCPLCDGACDYWHLSTACGTARASHLFDNPGTVFFAIFMSLWAVLFLEQWKRRQISLSFSWDLTGIEEDEEHPRPRYETVLLQKRQRKQKKKKPRRKTEGADGAGTRVDRDTGTRWDVPESLTAEAGGWDSDREGQMETKAAVHHGSGTAGNPSPPASCLLPPFFLSPLILPFGRLLSPLFSLSHPLVSLLGALQLLNVFCDLVHDPLQLRGRGGGLKAPTDAAARHHRAKGVGSNCLWKKERLNAESKREKDNEREVLNSTERLREVEDGENSREGS